MGFMNSKFRPVAPARLDQRAEKRRLVLLQRATVRQTDLPPIEARLVDLSSYGCRLLVSCKLKTGLKLLLRFNDADPVVATSVWSDGKHIGCRFDNAIDRDLFRSLTLSLD